MYGDFMSAKNKEGYVDKNSDFRLEWFVEKDIDEDEVSEEDGSLGFPETKEEWDNAELYEYDGGEIGNSVEDSDNLRDAICPELISFLEDNGYSVDIVIELDNKEPLKVSKMGRKKLVNISAKNENLKVGDEVKVIKKKR